MGEARDESGGGSSKAFSHGCETKAASTGGESILTAARANYYKKIEDADKNEHHKLRALNIGDTVIKSKVMGTNKKEDKIGEQQEGPYEVVDIGDSGADYKIKRIGTK